MKLNESNSGKWMSAKNAQDGDMVKFLDEGSWQESTRFKYDDGNPVKQFIIGVEHDGEEKRLTLIKASRVAMIEAYGDDTSDWVGKSAKINLAMNTQGGKSIILSSEKGVIDLDEPEASIPF